MIDVRSLREIIISRIEAYIRGIEYYDEEAAETYVFDFDSMTDSELSKAFERVLWDSQKIKRKHREQHLDERRRR